MERLILLDAGPVGLAAQQAGKPGVDRCKAWLSASGSAGARVILPEITDHEGRREWLRVEEKNFTAEVAEHAEREDREKR